MNTELLIRLQAARRHQSAMKDYGDICRAVGSLFSELEFNKDRYHEVMEMINNYADKREQYGYFDGHINAELQGTVEAVERFEAEQYAEDAAFASQAELKQGSDPDDKYSNICFGGIPSDYGEVALKIDEASKKVAPWGYRKDGSPKNKPGPKSHGTG